ncbi:MAG: carboxypeptidase-like regulatory domain-containing protein [Pedobacter sp.]
MKTYALLVFLLFNHFNTVAQSHFTLSGTILDENSEPVEAATVFIDGSQKISQTDAKGRYSFTGLTSGGYQLVVNMIGSGSMKQEVLIQDKSIVLNIRLTTKSQNLKEVIITGDGQRLKYLTTFKKFFLGESENAKRCKILNLEVLNFSLEKQILRASTNDFLLIENPVLGYTVKYLLRDFQYNGYLETTQYHGECIFEEMEGSDAQKQTWLESRREAYYGSLMHYLRSLHKGDIKSQGFLTYKVTNDRLPAVINIDAIAPKQFAQRVDSNLIRIRYKRRLYTIYNRDLAARNYSFEKKDRIITQFKDTGSIFSTDGQIDSKGNYFSYKALLIQGYWGRKRIGDQLPYEYVPD